jgi:hypothetical protein
MLAATFLSVFIPEVKAQPMNIEAYGPLISGGTYTITDVTYGYSASSVDYTSLYAVPEDVMTFTVVPPTGYIFDHWELFYAGASQGNISINPYTFVLSSTWYSYISMEAHFTLGATPAPTPLPIPDPGNFTATANGAGGTFVIADLTTGAYSTGVSSTALNFNSSDIIRFSVTPPTGYLFAYWTDGVSTYYANPISQILSADKTMTANYVANTGAYQYQLHGPYIENGNLYDGIVNVTVNYASLPSGYYLFNGSLGAETNLNLTSPSPITTVTWNVTSVASQRRTYSFSSTATTGELWIYVSNSNDPFEVTNTYGVSVSDLAGLTNAYVQTTKNIEGYQRIIERQILDPINAMPFWLIQFTQYNLMVVSDQGSFTFGLPADTIWAKNYAVTRDMVAQNFTGQNITISAFICQLLT